MDMRGDDLQQSGLFSYVSPETRVPRQHPLRAIRTMFDTALGGLSKEFDQMYSGTGRPSIAPEKLLRALLLQMLYSVRSERLLMEELDYNLLFRWFVGLNVDEALVKQVQFRVSDAKVSPETFTSKAFRDKVMGPINDRLKDVFGVELAMRAAVVGPKERGTTRDRQYRLRVEASALNIA